MIREPIETTRGAEGMQPEPLSNEVLKLKVDDLFQEVEQLKRRFERLEGRLGHADAGGSRLQQQTVVSDPDRREESGLA